MKGVLNEVERSLKTNLKIVSGYNHVLRILIPSSIFIQLTLKLVVSEDELIFTLLMETRIFQACNPTGTLKRLRFSLFSSNSAAFLSCLFVFRQAVDPHYSLALPLRENKHSS